MSITDNLLEFHVPDLLLLLLPWSIFSPTERVSLQRQLLRLDFSSLLRGGHVLDHLRRPLVLLLLHDHVRLFSVHERNAGSSSKSQDLKLVSDLEAVFERDNRGHLL